MHRINSARRATLSMTPLAACLSLALALTSTSILAAPSSIPVDNCDDAGPGSLRDIVQNVAQSGDIVSLSSLPMACGMTNSTITLTSAEIAFAQNDLTLQGPDAGKGTVSISGNHTNRVFNHNGGGVLTLNNVTIEDGAYLGSGGTAAGGCIRSGGSVVLQDSNATGCVVSSADNLALGGAIFAYNHVTLTRSTVSGNQALAPMAYGRGGGVYAYGGAYGTGGLSAKYSTLSNNVVQDGVNCGAGGGAFVAGGGTLIGASTLDNNQAGCGSAVRLSGGPVTISDSTMSDNLGSKNGAVELLLVDSASVGNSTIAFNHVTTDGAAAGLRFVGKTASSTLSLQSSILANNTAGATNTPLDVFFVQGVLSGNDNLIIAANVPLQGIATVQTDPMLGQLQFNGGPTRTRALLRGSPAIGLGNNAAAVTVDQRGTGYPRTTGASATVDIGAFEFDSIFAGGFE